MRKMQLYDMEEEYEENWDSRPSGKKKGSGSRSYREGYEEGYREARKRYGGEPEPVVNTKQRTGRGNKTSVGTNSPVGNHSNMKNTRSKKKRKKSGFGKFLFVLLVLAAILLGGLYCVVGMVYDKINYVEITDLKHAPVKEKGAVNILLIGNDSRENGDDGRSDAMILLTISSKTKKVYMTSLLRDMYVDIPGHKGNRLNAAYSYGGAELLMETIEKNLGITVNRYVLVNFEAFAGLVDAVGGVELELTKEEIEYVNGYLVEYNILLDRPQGTDNMDASHGGLVHLNGAQALAYSRNRYLGTDFGRTERQRKVLSQVIKKLPKGAVKNPQMLIDQLCPNLTTNLTKTECFFLCFDAAKLLLYDMEQNSLPLPGSYKDATIRGMSVLEVDFEENKAYLQEIIYGK